MGESLPDLIRTFGPGLLFAMAFAETAVLAGILSPSGTALAVAVALALAQGDGWGSLSVAMIASGTGALAGDQAGYWLGRRGSVRIRSGSGWVGRSLRGYEGLTSRLFTRHSALAVGLGRPIPYVRTLMPLTAGMNRVPWLRFTVLDLVGVVVWVAIYGVVGFAGGRGWRWVSEQAGTGWALGAGVLVLAIWAVWHFGVRPRRLASGNEAEGS